MAPEPGNEEGLPYVSPRERTNDDEQIPGSEPVSAEDRANIAAPAAQGEPYVEVWHEAGEGRPTVPIPVTVALSKRMAAEFFGTMWLVLGGVGTAVLTGVSPNVSVGSLGVAFAFGLTVLTMVYAVGPISGCHLNPAVTLGLSIGKRFPARDVVPYWIAQVVGGIVGAAIVFAIASGHTGFSASDGFASNGYGAHSPGGFGIGAAIVAEIVLTFFFVLVIHGATDWRAPKALAGVGIGLTLTLIHLISIPVTNTSVNPARSIAPAIFAGGWALSQLWLFIVMPLVGGAVAGLLYRMIFEARPQEGGVGPV